MSLAHYPAWGTAFSSPEQNFDMNHFWNCDWSEVFHFEVILCSIVLSLSGILTAAAGIGGGGILVTVLMVFGRLTPFDAVPLSKAIVFLGSLSSFALNRQKTYRGSGGQDIPVVDWRICKLIIPMALTGTLLGVLLNKHTPGWGVVIMLTAVLLFMTGTVVSKGVQQYMSEEAILQSCSSDSPDCSETSGLLAARDLPSPEKPSFSQAPSETGEACFSTKDAILLSMLLTIVVLGGVLRHHTGFCIIEKTEQLSGTKESACHHPLLKVIFGKSLESWITDEGLGQFIMASVVILPIWTCIIIAMNYSHTIVAQDGYELSRVMTYQAMALITGLLAGLLGIGGGLIFSPFLLILGMEPAVAVATSATCVIFTSSSTTLQYLLIDRIHISLAIVYGFVNVAASYVGTLVVHHLQDKFSARKSWITFIVAAAVAASAVLSVMKFIEEVDTIASTHHAPMAKS